MSDETRNELQNNRAKKKTFFYYSFTKAGKYKSREIQKQGNIISGKYNGKEIQFIYAGFFLIFLFLFFVFYFL